MTTPSMSTAALAAAVVSRVLLLTGCEPHQKSDEAIAVSSTADKCDVSAQEAPAGTLKVDVTNDGTEVTEFYLLGEDSTEAAAKDTQLSERATTQSAAYVKDQTKQLQSDTEKFAQA
ncbi:MAG: cupredoxin domain-containing protein [Brevibacterium sp.]|uniref:hypothetical protein n=1 Tax=Brevibacterium sp. TaxID=1701 RepID=UPI00264AC8CC|nr:cupredoxin domain-containing protein [Brevibacterium sp.]